MINDILLVLWFFIPAGAANIAPNVITKIPGVKRLNWPLDFGGTWRHKPIFGPNKTWRGLIAGILAASLVFWAQIALVDSSPALARLTAEVNYAGLSPVVMGFLFGLGTLGGDAIESFFKRQRGIKSGHSWFPFDQCDYIIGASLATWFLVPLTWFQYLLALVIWVVLHLAGSYVGYLLKFKERPI